MADLGNNLMIFGLDVIIILLKIWLFLIMVSTTFVNSRVFVFSMRDGIPMILRYNFDCSS